MKIESLIYEHDHWKKTTDTDDIENSNLVIVFGDIEEFKNQEHYDYLKKRYPDANIIGCSTAGNIFKDEITKSPMIAAAIAFNSAETVLKSLTFDANDNIEKRSYDLAKKFDRKGLRHVLILADGMKLSGSDVVSGFNRALDVPKTGGLAADGFVFEKSMVIANAPASENVIAALGFYGESLSIGYGSVGGWSEFGTPRTITKSKGNTLYELEGESVLDYYRRYLNIYSDNLHDITLKFPFGIKEKESDTAVIRAPLMINYEDSSITVAGGDMPEGYTAQLMKAKVDLLIEGAGEAARIAKKASVDSHTASALALAISCGGRISVMGQLVDEEIEEIAEALGENINLIGFYSYGEIAPFQEDILNCKLHNQTMTITVIDEK